MFTRKALVLIITIALSPWTIGCTNLECGDGTIEVDGICELDGTKSPTEPQNCGQFTHYDNTTLTCVPDNDPTVCDPSTSVKQPDPDNPGSFICVGIGGAGCGGTFLCPAPNDGKVTICGQLINVADNTMIQAADADGTLCDPDNPTADGPCSLAVTFYDAVAFAGNPDTALPLPSGDVEIDNCGRYRGPSIDVPGTAPYIGVAVDNANGVNIWRRSGVAVLVSANLLESKARTYAVKATTITAWTSTAGVDFGGDDFWEHGVYVPLFMIGTPVIDRDDPANNVPKRVAGVTITAAGNPDSSRDWYFSDTDPNQLTTVVPATGGQDATGANGAGLMVDSALDQHSGTGGEPSGCVWASNLAASIPNVAFIQEKIAEVDGMPGEICP